MCGIFGIASTSGFDPAEVARSTDLMRHRGPDGEGFLIWAMGETEPRAYGGPDTPAVLGLPAISSAGSPGRVGLGHRRLSVQDPSPAGHQPMKGSNGVWLSFNGEVYNFVELRDELLSVGHRFESGTDSEVILAAWAEWGPACVERFNGMWGLAILDAGRGELFLSRDRTGVKPLYYQVGGDGTLSFASEIKALLRLPGMRPTVDRQTAWNFLRWGIIPSGAETFFEGIRQLEPGHNLFWNADSGATWISRYYDLAERVQNRGVGRLDIDEIRESLERAVSIRLRSDVPVGTCLSGGLDSSSLAVLVNRELELTHPHQLGERQLLFTASYADSRIDESDFAARVAQSIPSTWHRTWPSAEGLLTDLNRIVWHQDEPFMGPSIYAQWEVMRLAREQGVTVLLDGQGGDELFAGYESQYPPFFFELLRQGRLLRVARELSALDHAPLGGAALMKWMARFLAMRGLPAGVRRRLAARAAPEVRYLDTGFRNEHSGVDAGVMARASFSTNEASLQLISRFTLPHLLRWEDRNSMAHSIESRTPLADDFELIELVLSIPGREKIRDGWSKWLLREAVGPLLPEAIRYRTDKKGFDTPELDWLRTCRPALETAFSRPSAYLDTSGLLSDLDQLLSADADVPPRALWRFLIFQVWLDTFIEAPN